MAVDLGYFFIFIFFGFVFSYFIPIFFLM